MKTERIGHTATLLPNGLVLVAGGSDNTSFLASAELYDPARGKWTPTGSMSIPRLGQMATLLQNGEVLVSGGKNASASALASAELYNPSTDTWTVTGSMSAARDDDTA